MGCAELRGPAAAEGAEQLLDTDNYRCGVNKSMEDARCGTCCHACCHGGDRRRRVCRICGRRVASKKTRRREAGKREEVVCTNRRTRAAGPEPMCVCRTARGRDGVRVRFSALGGKKRKGSRCRGDTKIKGRAFARACCRSQLRLLGLQGHRNTEYRIAHWFENASWNMSIHVI